MIYVVQFIGKNRVNMLWDNPGSDHKWQHHVECCCTYIAGNGVLVPVLFRPVSGIL